MRSPSKVHQRDDPEFSEKVRAFSRKVAMLCIWFIKNPDADPEQRAEVYDYLTSLNLQRLLYSNNLATVMKCPSGEMYYHLFQDIQAALALYRVNRVPVSAPLGREEKTPRQRKKNPDNIALPKKTLLPEVKEILSTYAISPPEWMDESLQQNFVSYIQEAKKDGPLSRPIVESVVDSVRWLLTSDIQFSGK